MWSPKCREATRALKKVHCYIRVSGCEFNAQVPTVYIKQCVFKQRLWENRLHTDPLMKML